MPRTLNSRSISTGSFGPETRNCRLVEAIGSYIWVFPKIRGTFFGVPIIRIIVFWGLYWGLLILGNYHIDPKPTNLGEKDPTNVGSKS